MRRTLFVLAVVVTIAVGCEDAKPPKKAGGGEVQAPKVEEKKPRTRAELKDLLVGKGKEDVRKLLGKPDSTDDYAGGGGTWAYWSRGVSYDPESGKTDRNVAVRFDPDWVVEGFFFY